MASKRKRKTMDGPRPQQQQQPRKKIATGGGAGTAALLGPSKPAKQAIVPFENGDHILLVGEGDFSFARSLCRHHGHRFTNLTATTVVSKEELLEKHPQAEDAIAEITKPISNTSTNKHDIPAGSDDEENDSDQQHQLDLDHEDGGSEGNSLHSGTSRAIHQPARVLYKIDATRLPTYPALRKSKPPITKIVFNFPHVGGRSTDVNRQVRYNQALVHGYLEASVTLLSAGKAMKPSSKAIFVTLFEGEPYSLWNVRDLGRSVGLVVRRSWAFDAGLYPGYQHARTLGNLKGQEGDAGDGDDEERESEKKKKGPWRGEQRNARTFEFGLKEGSEGQASHSGGGAKKKKRKRKEGGGESSSSD